MAQAPPLCDGLVSIYREENTAAPGDAPKVKPVKKGVLRYRRRTVGLNRYYTAGQANVRVDLLLRVPWMREVSVQDIAVPTLDGKPYRITLIQVPEDIAPPVMDLQLERLAGKYDLP